MFVCFFKEWHVKIYLILIRGRGLATFNQKINILYTLKIGSECCLSFNLIPSFSFWSQCKQHDQLHCCCTRFRFFILYLICHTIMRLTNDDIYSLYIECICLSLCLLMCCCTSAREIFVQMDTPPPLHVNGCQIWADARQLRQLIREDSLLCHIFWKGGDALCLQSHLKFYSILVVN